METPKSKTSDDKSGKVIQLTADEIDRMRLEARQDGAWAKLQLGSRAENSNCIERQAAQFAHSSAAMPGSNASSVMSNGNDQAEAEAEALTIDCYSAVECAAQREKVGEAEKLVELRAGFDQRLSSLNGHQAHQALNAFMDEPIKLSEILYAGAPY